MTNEIERMTDREAEVRDCLEEIITFFGALGIIFVVYGVMLWFFRDSEYWKELVSSSVGALGIMLLLGSYKMYKATPRQQVNAALKAVRGRKGEVSK